MGANGIGGGGPLAAAELRHFGADHLGALAFCALATLGACLWGRGAEAASRRRFARGLALLIALGQGAHLVRAAVSGRWTPKEDLPCHLCDLASLLCVATLWWPHPPAVTVLYFLGLGGALQAVLTPAVRQGFPHWRFLQFFVVHVGIVVASAFLVLGHRRRLGRHAWLWGFAALNLCALLATAANLAFDANYMFLRRVPAKGSLLDLFGAWPWYIVTAEGFALLLFALLQLPFWLRSAAGGAGPPAKRDDPSR
jgi:hypothetical integral membrane protein (TIGR02206 family)